MNKNFIFILLVLFQTASAQIKNYRQSLLAFRQNYINTHEVVLKENRKFLRFYDINERYRVIASFKRIKDQTGFDMNTSSGKKKKHFIYGLLSFRLHDSLVHLYVYQSAALMKQKKLKDYLFVPFGDATSGFESYGGGRYMEFNIPDIKNNKVTLDFNKAYNPYCAYTTGFNCPIPPVENIVRIPVAAGEKDYARPIH